MAWKRKNMITEQSIVTYNPHLLLNKIKRKSFSKNLKMYRHDIKLLPCFYLNIILQDCFYEELCIFFWWRKCRRIS